MSDVIMNSQSSILVFIFSSLVFHFSFQTLQPLNFPTFARMSEVKVKIINQSGNELPQYATAGSAGMDIRANLSEKIILKPLERYLVPTGLYIELPEGYEMQIRPRSGLAIKQGITCLNSPGTIDSDYRGEIKVILINLSAEEQAIQNGDRIAQAVLGKVKKAKWKLVTKINSTERNEGGFGHTGKS
jgi:dUTP pyrophosphatase